MNALAQWIWDRFSPSTSQRTVTGNMPDDEEAMRVRDRFFSKKEEPKDTKSRLYDRMQSGDH